eukprot:2230329-Alexandrium_andersonii.AAC.1
MVRPLPRTLLFQTLTVGGRFWRWTASRASPRHPGAHFRIKMCGRRSFGGKREGHSGSVRPRQGRRSPKPTRPGRPMVGDRGTRNGRSWKVSCVPSEPSPGAQPATGRGRGRALCATIVAFRDSSSAIASSPDLRREHATDAARLDTWTSTARRTRERAGASARRLRSCSWKAASEQ